MNIINYVHGTVHCIIKYLKQYYLERKRQHNKEQVIGTKVYDNYISEVCQRKQFHFTLTLIIYNYFHCHVVY